MQSVSVYSVQDLEPVRLMSAPYARYEVVDLDGDDDLELGKSGWTRLCRR